jgi:TetR/AcrR family transcriptional regulator, regulator of cefoperazone and chloramphenicol sensitivity
MAGVMRPANTKRQAMATKDKRGKRLPVKRRYPRGVETRQRIVEAALQVFGAEGYRAASTRLIAKRAGVTLPSFQYYFAGKHGLYLACAEYIRSRITTLISPAIRRIEAAMRAENASDELRKMLMAVLDQCCDLLVGSKEAENWALFIMREQANPTAAFVVIYDGILQHIIGLCSQLIAKLLERREDDHVRLHALSLFAQLLVFRTARATALRTMGWTDIGDAQLALIKRALHLQIEGIGRA